eukprot:362044-Chlamydomonas_euryale.AAC.5
MKRAAAVRAAPQTAPAVVQASCTASVAPRAAARFLPSLLLRLRARQAATELKVGGGADHAGDAAAARIRIRIDSSCRLAKPPGS